MTTNRYDPNRMLCNEARKIIGGNIQTNVEVRFVNQLTEHAAVLEYRKSTNDVWHRVIAVRWFGTLGIMEAV